MSQEVIEITEREIEVIEVVEKGPAGPAGPQPDINYEVVSSARTLEAADLIAADTSGGAFTLTLPLNPSAGDAVDIFDYSETFDTNPLTIARNGENIESVAEDLICNVEGAYFTMIYTGSTRGWQILPRYGGGGSGGELTTQGDILYRGTSVNERLPIGTAGQILKVNSGATAPEWGTAPDSIDDYTVVTTSQTITNGARIAANTTSGSFTLTLPATPQDGDTVYILDFASTFDTNNLTLGRNGSNIEGLAEDMVCNVEGSSFKMVYTGATNGWQMIPYYGAGVAIGSNATDVLSLSLGQIVADDPAADRIVFWDDSENKLTYGSVGDVGAAEANHTHSASAITSGTLAHERGGLEADVSAYNGLLKIASGSTSAVTVTTAGEALLDDADAAAQRTTLGLGTAATVDADQDLDTTDDVAFNSVTAGDNSFDEEGLKFDGELRFSPEEGNFYYGGGIVFGASAGAATFNVPIDLGGINAATNKATTRTNLGLGDSAVADIGTGSGDVAAGDHTHELTALDATGATNGHVLTAQGDGTAAFAASGGVTGAASSASDVLGVSGSDITGVDATADRIVFWDDSASKLAYLEVSTGLSLSGTTLTATASGGSKTYAVFSATDNQPPSTAFATLDTRNSIAVLDFDDATDESAVFVSIIPEGASLGSGLKIRLHWMATTATSGNVVWDVSLERMTTDLDSDSFDTIASGTAAANGTSGILTVTEITLTTIDSVTAGDGFRLKVTRDANNASDTMTGDAELVAVEVRSAA